MSVLGLHQDLSFPYSAPPWLEGVRRARLSLPPILRTRPAPDPPPRVRPRPHPPAPPFGPRPASARQFRPHPPAPGPPPRVRPRPHPPAPPSGPRPASARQAPPPPSGPRPASARQAPPPPSGPTFRPQTRLRASGPAPTLRPHLPAPDPPPRVRPRPHPPALVAFSHPPWPWQPLCARWSRTSGPLWRGAAADRASARTPPTLCLPPAEPPLRAPAFLTGGRVRVRRLHTQRPPALRSPRPAAACAGPASASPRSSRSPQPGLPEVPTFAFVGAQLGLKTVASGVERGVT